MMRAVLILALLAATPAAAQTAADYNRANQALQICSSPMGAGIPECAKLRGKFGMSSVASPGGANLGGAAGIAGILGNAMNAAQRPAAASMAPPSPAANPAAVQQAIAVCVKGAAGNPAVIQQCLAIANNAPAAVPARPAYAPTPGQVVTPSLMAGDTAARATYQAGAGYQACVASGTDWQTCMRRMNGGQ